MATTNIHTLGRRVLTLLPVLCLGVCSLTARAEEPHHGDSEEWSHARNKLELFLGATHVESDDEFSVGLTYEYRINETFGLGGLVEYTDGVGTWLWALPVFIHPVEPWRLVVAPGLELEGSEDEFLLRIGVAYEWEFGEWSVAPELNLDFVDSETNEVFGVSFGRRF